MNTGYEKLDNPVWHSLSEVHRDISINYQNIKFYHPSHCAFGGFSDDNNLACQIDQYVELVNNFFIVGEKPVFSQKLFLKKELVCLQMVLDERIELHIEEHIKKLDDTLADALSSLVNEVQPGYFKEKTNLMGNYFGIIKNDKLVAAAGERMKMNGFTEVSAIVTHPSHTRKGFAKQLIAHVANNIFDEGKVPYLHVAETNSGAIALYQKLGFKIRRKIIFWNLEVRQNN